MLAKYFSMVCILCVQSVKLQAHDDNPYPNGVVYHAADEAINTQATQRLSAALADNGATFNTLLKQTIENKQKIMVGMFLSIRLLDQGKFGAKALRMGINKVPLDSEHKYVADGPILLAENSDQSVLLANALINTTASSTPVILRKLTKEEIALIWYFIGWDIDEPIFVANLNDRHIVFDFDPSGTYINWIEDISEPCFKLAIDSVKTPCFCASVLHEDNDYGVIFDQKAECSH